MLAAGGQDSAADDLIPQSNALIDPYPSIKSLICQSKACSLNQKPNPSTKSPELSTLKQVCSQLAGRTAPPTPETMNSPAKWRCSVAIREMGRLLGGSLHQATHVDNTTGGGRHEIVLHTQTPESSSRCAHSSRGGRRCRRRRPCLRLIVLRLTVLRLTLLRLPVLRLTFFRLTVLRLTFLRRTVASGGDQLETLSPTP